MVGACIQSSGTDYDLLNSVQSNEEGTIALCSASDVENQAMFDRQCYDASAPNQTYPGACSHMPSPFFFYAKTQ